MELLKNILRFPYHLASSLRMSKLSALSFFTSWLCWTVACMHFYCLPYSMEAVAKSLGVPQSTVSEANTTSLLTRSVGAAIFGIVADQYGRKIAILIDLVLLGVFTLSSGFVHTSAQLIAVRVLFGVAFGGLYGPNMAACLEAVPRKARGAVGGFTQQGFAAGNLLASAFHLATNKYGWQPLYYVAAGLTVPCFILRLVTPSYSVIGEAVREAEGTGRVGAPKVVGGELLFWTKFRYAVVQHWPIFIYTLILTSAFNTLGHGHLDLYPSFLSTQKGLDVLHQTWVTVILQSGGILGGLIGGHLCLHNVKWVPFCFAILIAPFLPLFILPDSWHLLALGAFFFEFCYGSAIGALGNILQIISPHPGIRAAFGGVAYNLGNAVSSFAPTAEARLGEENPLPNGKPNYGQTILILAGTLIGVLSIVLACMPMENLNMDWDMQDPSQIEASQQAIKIVPNERSGEEAVENGKGDVIHMENISVSRA